MLVSKYKGWRLLSLTKNDIETDKRLFEAIESNDYEIVDILKDHHRSKVFRINILDQDLVLKVPLEKNRKKWIRFTTLFRSGEAFRNIKGMHGLERAGIKTTTPIMAAELRSYNMVTDSWLLYNYLEGDSCLDNQDKYAEVVSTLRNIHSKGLLHGDPQIRNFISTPKGMYVIDCNPTKRGLLGFDVGYEFAYLRKSTEGIEPFFGEISNTFWYQYAKKYDIYERKMARTRRKIKKKIGLRVIE